VSHEEGHPDTQVLFYTSQ